MAGRSPQIELVLDARAGTGENPVWNEKEQRLYWIDIEEPALHRLDPATGADESFETPARIGSFALCESGAILVALRSGLARIRTESGAFEPLCAPPYNPLSHRFNDGKCDARGRFWVGTMQEKLRGFGDAQTPAAKPVSVYTCRSGLQERNACAVIANGIAWSPDSRTMYFTDTHAGTIWAFGYDLETTSLSSRRVFAQFDVEKGSPDGAAVDAEGFYWCALYGGSRVLRLAPDGQIVRQIELPVSQPTMCAFGDADYETLYITSAAHGLKNEPLAGGVFRCRPGARGRPASLFADGA